MTDVLLSTNQQQLLVDLKSAMQTTPALQAEQLLKDITQQLQVGQQLIARIVALDKALAIELAGVRLPIAPSASELPQQFVGQTIRVEVRSLNQPIELKIITEPVRPSSSGKPPSETNAAGQPVRTQSDLVSGQSPTLQPQKLEQFIEAIRLGQRSKALPSENLKASGAPAHSRELNTKTTSNYSAPSNQPNPSRAESNTGARNEPRKTDGSNVIQQPTKGSQDKGVVVVGRSGKETQTLDKALNSKVTVDNKSSVIAQSSTPSDIKPASKEALPVQRLSPEMTAVIHKASKPQVNLPPQRGAEAPPAAVKGSSDKPNISNLQTEVRLKQAELPNRIISSYADEKIRPNTEPNRPSSNTGAVVTGAAQKQARTPEGLSARQINKITTPTDSMLAQKQESNVKRDEAMPPLRNIEARIPKPDAQKFPEIAMALSTAFQNVQVVQSITLDKPLNQLLDQLNRLNQWMSDAPKAKHSEQGQTVSQLAKQVKEVLSDLFRYIEKSDRPSRQVVERRMEQSGTQYDKHVESHKHGKENLNLHKDLKANLVRTERASLYVLAKLSKLINTLSSSQRATAGSPTTTGNPQTSASTGTPASPAQSTNLTGTGLSQEAELLGQARKTPGRAGLIDGVKQRLNALVKQQIEPQKLIELERIVRQVLDSSKSALSRTQLLQLANVRTEATATQWLFELPVKVDDKVDVFQIEIEKQKKTDHRQQQVWALTVQFDLEPMGKVLARLTLKDKAYDIDFFAESHDTVKLVSEELDSFREQLKQAELQVNNLSVKQRMLKSMQFTELTNDR